VARLSARFSGQPGLERLLGAGWTDGWRHLNGQRREYTWYSHHGNGFRIDHTFLSPSALPRLKAARYDHAPRRRKVSDHSMLWVEIEGGG
jgi:exonuclease III